MTIAIVILNWNGRHFLETFLPSVIANSTAAEVIIADNGSSDDSVSYLEKNFPSVRIIRLEKNLGFTGGVNAGIRHAMAQGADYVWLMNGDAETNPDVLQRLVTAAEADARDREQRRMGVELLVVEVARHVEDDVAVHEGVFGDLQLVSAVVTFYRLVRDEPKRELIAFFHKGTDGPVEASVQSAELGGTHSGIVLSELKNSRCFDAVGTDRVGGFQFPHSREQRL